jgi:hypothetical protein
MDRCQIEGALMLELDDPGDLIANMGQGLLESANRLHSLKGRVS